MSKKALVANVSVGGVTYLAGSTPPREVADQIDNPKAWGEDPDAGREGKPASRATSKK